MTIKNNSQTTVENQSPSILKLFTYKDINSVTMKGKVLIALISFFLLLYALYSTPIFPQGREFLTGLITGAFKEKLPSGFFIFQEKKEPFKVRIQVETSSLEMPNGRIENSSFFVEGICLENIELSSTNVLLENRPCTIKGKMEGMVNIKEGIVKIEGKPFEININSMKYGAESFRTRVLAKKVNFEKVSFKEFTLEVLSGQIEKLKNGKVDMLKYLSKDSVKVKEFKGEIQIDNNTLIANGEVIGVSNDFEW